jgi:uncharacterized HhH-GPD family protein
VELHLSQNPEADALLSKSPFALLVGMVLDQQVPLEWAFASPLELERRLGKPLEPKRIAQMDPESLAAAFSAKPALHRYPGSMAARVQDMATLLVERYRGRPEDLWDGVATGAELLARVKELPGFGEHKAKIFVALLGKQLGVRPEGWEAASAPFGDPGSFRSVADITNTDTLDRVRAFKQALKAANKAKRSPDEAEHPGKAPVRADKAAGRPSKPVARSGTPTARSGKKTAGTAPPSRATATSGKR